MDFLHEFMEGWWARGRWTGEKALVCFNCIWCWDGRMRAHKLEKTIAFWRSPFFCSSLHNNSYQQVQQLLQNHSRQFVKKLSPKNGRSRRWRRCQTRIQDEWGMGL